MKPLTVITVSLDRGLVTPIPMRYDACEGNKNDSRLKVGELYGLQGKKCEDFEMPQRVYSCKAIIKDLNDVPLDAVVMKQMDDNNDFIFSLTRVDCEMLGIEYEPKLQLFPLSFDWTPIVRREEVVYDPKNLGTYKPSLDGTIKQMHIFIRFIFPFSANKNALVTPKGSVLPIDDFFHNFHVEFKDEALRNEYPTIIAKPILTKGEGSSLFDKEKEGINMLLSFTSSLELPGINPSCFEGKCFDDLFSVYWYERYKETRPSVQRTTTVTRSRMPKPFRSTTPQRDIIKEFYEKTVHNQTEQEVLDRLWEEASNFTWTRNNLF